MRWGEAEGVVGVVRKAEGCEKASMSPEEAEKLMY